jgi:D-sedoheptulose 7-phosphate isomerase
MTTTIHCDTAEVKRLVSESSECIQALGDQADKVCSACDAVIKALRSGCKLLIAGNGGSAAEAMHMAEELTGRFKSNRRPLPAIALVADPTALTCIGNDFGFEHIFSRQVEALGVAGDVLVLFSTSGKSPNLKLALDAAAAKGLTVVSVLGRDGGDMAGRSDVEIIVRCQATERIQEAHQVILHIVLAAVEKAFV